MQKIKQQKNASRRALANLSDVLTQGIDAYASNAQEILKSDSGSINRILDTYFSEQDREVQAKNRFKRSTLLACQAPTLQSIDHATVLEDTPCGCAICTTWLKARDDLALALKLQPQGHKVSTCACATCRFINKLQLGYLAAANKRDLLISVAFHAQHHANHPDKVMTWIDAELVSARYDVNWAAVRMSLLPVGYWLVLCQTVSSGVIVFDIDPEYLQTQPDIAESEENLT